LLGKEGLKVPFNERPTLILDSLNSVSITSGDLSTVIQWLLKIKCNNLHHAQFTGITDVSEWVEPDDSEIVESDTMRFPFLKGLCLGEEAAFIPQFLTVLSNLPVLERLVFSSDFIKRPYWVSEDSRNVYSFKT